MSVLLPIFECEQQLRKLRVSNYIDKKFIPEKAIRGALSRESVRDIIRASVPIPFNPEEIIDFALEDAPKIFGILVLISRTSFITQFIQNDQLRPHHIDDSLPFSEEDLLQILRDSDVASQFYERQWEFCAPVFSGKIYPRSFHRSTILPFLQQSRLAKGRYGDVYKISIHPSHRPSSYQGEISVR